MIDGRCKAMGVKKKCEWLSIKRIDKLSIDSYAKCEGGIILSNKQISSREEIEAFLHDLIKILNAPEFDIDNDLDVLLKKKSESPIDPYTTANTLLELGFDKTDIRHHLISLELSNYMETILDDKNPSFPPFHVFAKEIKNRDVYIKVKIRNRIEGKIFCVSFHFARFSFPQTLPYA